MKGPFGSSSVVGHPKAVGTDRTCRDVPDFRDDLWRHDKAFAAADQTTDAADRRIVQGVSRLDAPKKDVRVDEDAH